MILGANALAQTVVKLPPRGDAKRLVHRLQTWSVAHTAVIDALFRDER